MKTTRFYAAPPSRIVTPINADGSVNYEKLGRTH